MDKRSKYEILDAEILRKIDATPVSFGALYSGVAHEQCGKIAASENKDPDEAFRILDRRLQALRKAGKISSTSRGWVLAERSMQ